MHGCVACVAVCGSPRPDERLSRLEVLLAAASLDNGPWRMPPRSAKSATRMSKAGNHSSLRTRISLWIRFAECCGMCAVAYAGRLHARRVPG